MESKADSLFLSQACRLIQKSNSKEYSHVKYWLGLYLKDEFPDMGEGPHAEIISPYFQHMRALLSAAITVGDIEVKKLHLVSAKRLYQSFTSTFPPPKVVFKFDVCWEQVWARVQDPVLEIKSREVLFMIIHNIVANKDRVFRFNMIASPNCPTCAVVQDNVHLFCECVRVQEAWFWLRQRLLDLLPYDAALTSNFEFIHLMFVPSLFDREMIWLIGVYVGLVWNQVICKSKFLSKDFVKIECAQQFDSHHMSKKPPLGHIIGLFQ